jgi:hypothetical protein
MGIRHMTRVQAALDQALEQRAELAAFFDPNKSERFFIKTPLANRQGSPSTR